MPVFTFEKISSSTDGGLVPGTAQNPQNQSTNTQTTNNQSNSKKQRGRIVQFLDRFVDTRVSKSLRRQRGIAGKTSKA